MAKPLPDEYEELFTNEADELIKSGKMNESDYAIRCIVFIWEQICNQLVIHNMDDITSMFHRFDNPLNKTFDKNMKKIADLYHEKPDLDRNEVIDELSSLLDFNSKKSIIAIAHLLRLLQNAIKKYEKDNVPVYTLANILIHKPIALMEPYMSYDYNHFTIVDIGSII